MFRSAASRAAGVLAVPLGLGALLAVGWSLRRLRRFVVQLKSGVAAPRGGLGLNILGDIFCDVLITTKELPQWGQDTLATAPVQILPGGGWVVPIHFPTTCPAHTRAVVARGLNTATHFSGLATSSSCSLFSGVGPDSFGHMIRDHARSVGFTIHSVPADSTGVCAVITGPDDRAFVTHRGPIGSLSIDQLDRCQLLSGTHLHVRPSQTNKHPATMISPAWHPGRVCRTDRRLLQLPRHLGQADGRAPAGGPAQRHDDVAQPAVRRHGDLGAPRGRASSREHHAPESE